MKKNWGKMNDLPVLHDIKLSDEEKNYLNKTAKYRLHPSAILNTIVLHRITTYILGNLVGAMENPEFLVLKVTPEDIQKTYTIVRISIENSIVTIPMVPNHDNNTKK